MELELQTYLIVLPLVFLAGFIDSITLFISAKTDYLPFFMERSKFFRAFLRCCFISLDA